ncbi:MAG: hypothetical protein HY716_09450 [Planctomycetes bacterium]|nr:hypothetical protein [Planctomycetota bacterium]
MIHGSRLVVQPEFERLFKAQGVERVADVAAKWSPPAGGDGGRSRVTEVRVPHANGTAHLFVKTYHYPGWWRLRTLFIPARAKREYRNLQGLAHFGLRVPIPVAYGETRRLGLLTESVLVTEAVPHAIDLRELVTDPSKAPFPLPNAKERRELISTFARALRRCHDAGWFLHTVFFKNLLLTKDASGYELWVIDVPFAHIWRNQLLPEQGKIRDFACLLKGAIKLLSRTERMKFCKAYGDTDREFLRKVEAYWRRNYA